MDGKIYPILFLICIICVSNSYASQNNISTFFETGERAVTDAIEDRDILGNYDFYKYYVRFDQEVPKIFKYTLAYEYYRKDYETSDNLDTHSNQWRAGIDYVAGAIHELPLRFSIDAGYREKDYKNSPNLQYSRSNAAIGLDFKYEDSWSISWDSGFIDYEYDKDGGDQLKLFAKLGGWMKFFDERLKVAPSYKFQKVDQDTGKDRAEQIFTVSSYYKLGAPHFDKLGGYYSAGRNDTKDYEDDDRDDDLRFKYVKWHINTGHPLGENLDTSFKYGRASRHYANSDNNYRNWFIQNEASFKVCDDKIKKAKFSVQSEHKESDYTLIDTLRYIKNSAGAMLSYEIKNNWGLAPSFTFRKYDYSADPVKNEKQYEARIEFSKELLNHDLELKLAYKHLWKDFKYNADITQWSVKAGIEYKF